MLLGLDVGGTNIDAVIIKNGQIINKVKSPLYENDLLESILIVLDKLLQGYDPADIKRINLSTTVSTNAIVKNQVSTVGMLIQSGPGLGVDFLACGNENKFLSGSIDHRGRIIEDIDPQEITQAIKLFQKNNIDTCAVVTKFSTRNPNLEIKMKEMVDKYFEFTTAGYTLSGTLNFPRRVYTAYLNSAVHKTFNHFTENINQSFQMQNINAPIYILKADGGTMDLQSAQTKPVETILSGPAASFMGINALLPTSGDSLFLDIGGTTTDIFFLIDGVPLFEPLGIQIDQYKTLVRSIYSVSIGLGGDSKIIIEENKLKIGPTKEVKAYAFGGDNPTPTDAMIALDLIDDGDKQRAIDIMNKLGKQLNKSGKEMAALILESMADTIKNKVDYLLEKINSKPVYTVKEVLYSKEVKPEMINIIGGPAKSLTPIIGAKFGLPCRYPEHYHVANAIGAALAKPTMDLTLLADTQRKTLSIPELDIYKELKGKYDLDLAKKQAMALLQEHIKLMDYTSIVLDDEIEITEASSFNMVDGFYTTGKNIRVKAQVKPGLIYGLRGEKRDD